jgi:hypothetical protein
MRHRPPKLVPLVLAGTVSLAACSAVGSENPAPAQTASGDRLSLAGICPKKIVVQTGWYPQVERAAVYSLVGPQRKIDAAKKLVTGQLIAQGHDTGVQLEVRAGGPAIGFQPVSAQMYVDKSIMLGDMSTDESVQNSKDMPTLAVVAPLDIDPLAVSGTRRPIPPSTRWSTLGRPTPRYSTSKAPPRWSTWLAPGRCSKSRDYGLIVVDVTRR